MQNKKTRVGGESYSPEETESLVSFVVENDMIMERDNGSAYIISTHPKTDRLLEFMFNTFNKPRSIHGLRKQFKKAWMKASYDAPKKATPLQGEEPKNYKEDILKEVYGKVPYETFIKIINL
jgi:hypothetical protein